MISKEQLSRVVHACRIIEQSAEPPSTGNLAAAVNLSASYFTRLFKRVTGITPKEYSVMIRSDRLREKLSEKLPITEAIYAAGFNSGSRVYEQTDRLLAMNPSAYRDGGRGFRIEYDTAACSLGWVLAASTDRGICSILLGDSPKELREELERRFANAEIMQAGRDYSETVREVVGLIDNPSAGGTLPLDIRGTVFQQRVWKALQEIPAGETRTYSEVAEAIGNPKAARAVANACAENRLAVAIPCHRVIKSDGSTGGYRWGSLRKQKLLEKEAAAKLPKN